MKIKYLGTAAYEGWPALFCHCEACDEARKLGGKNIRTRSQTMINDDLMLDFPPDSYMHALLHNIDLSAIQYLLITHPHSDHFYPNDLGARGGCYGHNLAVEDLHIYCSYRTKLSFYREGSLGIDKAVDDHIQWHILQAFEPVQAGPYTITPLPARHMYEMPMVEPFFYLIESDKTLLYMHDTGRAVDDVLDYLQKEKKVVDLVSFDCTCCLMDGQENGGHMGFYDNKMLRDKMLARGICNENTRYVLNHFSHNGKLLHEEFCRIANPEGMDVAFDGMEVEL